MKTKTLIPLLSILIIGSVGSAEAEKNRLLILADMGNEPDEEQQMMHMMMCSNEFEVEGLIAVTGKFLRPESPLKFKQRIYPDLFHHLIEGYAKVVDNLRLHADGWPTPEYLTSIVKSGQTGYGIEDTGPGKSSEGSEWIIKLLKEEDHRPLYTVVNAGSNTLAQALKDLIERYGRETAGELIKKLRVYENGAQDNAGAWICSEFPEIHWVRSNYQTYCYGGPGIDGGFDNKGKKTELGPHTWKPYAYNALGQHHWLLEHIIANHGPFGNYYPLRQFHQGGITFIEGGGTIPWLSLVNKGLSDINNPWWGGWSGLFTREKVTDEWSKHQSVKVDEGQFSPFKMYTEVPDTWTDPDSGTRYENNIYSPVWRWRQAFFNDFVCRMDWCTGTYEETNHHPVAAIDGDSSDKIVFRAVDAGDSISFEASGSTDPDGDELDIAWYTYPEAGTYNGTVYPSKKNGWTTRLDIPEDASGSEIHLILEIKDKNEIASLYDYRRVVINVN